MDKDILIAFSSALVAITALILNYKGFTSIDNRLSSIENRLSSIESRLTDVQIDVALLKAGIKG